MGNKTDRRIQRTLQLLRESLIDLTLEKGYDAVSVQDITERANLGRATFYLHYKDKDELLIETLDAIVDDLIAQIERVPIEEWNLFDNAPALLVFRYAEKNADLYRIIMRGQGSMQVAQRLHEVMANFVQRAIETGSAKLGIKPKVPVDFLANYFAGSLLALITWWLENDPGYSAEEMVQMFRQVTFGDRIKLLKLNPFAPKSKL